MANLEDEKKTGWEKPSKPKPAYIYIKQRKQCQYISNVWEGISFHRLSSRILQDDDLRTQVIRKCELVKRVKLVKL